MHQRGLTLLLTLLLLATGLAGCIGGEDLDPNNQLDRDVQGLSALTEPIYETIQRTAHTIQGEVDGQETAGIWLDVYRPETEADVKVPTILVMTPYQALGDVLGAPGSLEDGEVPVPPEKTPYDGRLVDFFAPRGYAVAFADVRGNHNAGGCIDQSGPAQWRDGYYTVEWLASQDWSNGKVGMHGASYDGETQISTALLNPPSLTTIVPTASVQSQYQYLYYNGVPYELQGASTMAGYLAISAIPGTDPQAATTYHERLMCQPENFQHGADLSGDWNDYWEERAYFKLVPQVTNTSVLHIHGLQDWNVKPDHIDPQFNAWTTESRAIFGQWGHAYPDRDDWWGDEGILHRWYDHHLLGIDTGILDELPPVLIEDTEGDWRALDSFPPASQDRLTFYLGAEGVLSTAEAQAGEAVIHDYPRDSPGAGLSPVSNAAATAGETVTGHPAALTFTSPTFEEDTVLTGRPTLTFNVTTDAESTHWVAHLYLVEADGTRDWINRGYQDTRHLEGLDQPKALTPGEPYQLTLEMFPQNDVVPAGAHLELVVTNNDGWVHQDDTYATSTIQLDQSAVLALPLLPAGASSVPEDTLRG